MTSNKVTGEKRKSKAETDAMIDVITAHEKEADASPWSVVW